MKPLAFISFLLCLFYLLSCEPNYTPKPRGYHRINFPEKKYQKSDLPCPFSFEYPTYTYIKEDPSSSAKPYWYNIHYPMFNANIHLSYYTYSKDTTFQKYINDAKTFAFKHTVKASAIDERVIHSSERKIYGKMYEIGGNVASWNQFYLTDSLQHYLRGALYFNEKPKQDSIQIILDFIISDINHFIKTFKWETP